MSHILIFGQTHSIAELKAQLKGWGMSTGELLPGVDPPGQVSVDDCDAVILDLRGNNQPSWLREFLADHELAAPVLVLSHKNDQELDKGSIWADLTDEKTVDARLLLELQGAIAYSRQKRGLGAGLPGGSYLHFLGHELRSPLTAAKTALEALQSELSVGIVGSGKPVEVDAAGVQACLKMTDIALRNIQRLHQSVEWSQDLLTHMESIDAEEDSIESSILL